LYYSIGIGHKHQRGLKQSTNDATHNSCFLTTLVLKESGMLIDLMVMTSSFILSTDTQCSIAIVPAPAPLQEPTGQRG